MTSNGGQFVLSCHDFSHGEALFTSFPEFYWEFWKMKKSSKRYWKELKYQREYLDAVSRKLSLKDMSSWYSVSLQTFSDQKLPYSFITHKYGGSLQRALSTIYPNHNWIPWLFSKSPKRFWEDRMNWRRYLEWFADRVGFHVMEEWREVTPMLLSKHCGANLLYLESDLRKTITTTFPELMWKPKSPEKPNEKLWRQRLFELFGDIFIPRDWYMCCSILQKCSEEVLRFSFQVWSFVDIFTILIPT